MEVESETKRKQKTCLNEKTETEEKEERWQIKVKSLKYGINHIYETKELSDIEFIVSNKKYKAHRLILAARSPEFDKILFKNNVQKIICKNISEVGFDILLKFIYTDKLVSTNYQEILEAYQAALQFEQKELLKECETLMEKWELCNNVCTILNQATDNSFLTERCLKYIKNNSEAIITSEDFLKSTSDSIKNMLQNDCFEEIPIILVLHSILQWSEKQFPKLENNYTMVRDHLMLTGLLGRLKIHKLSTKELIQLNAEYPSLLTPQEFNQLKLYNLHIPGEKTLPEWIII